GHRGRATLRTRWCPRGDRGESPAQAATDRSAACSSSGAQPDAKRPAALRIRVALSHASPHSKARHRPASFDAASVTYGIGSSRVPDAVFLEVLSEEAWTKRARRGPYPSHRRTQITQSSVRLSTDCADHLAHVRNRHRQKRRVPGTGKTLSSGSGRHRAFV